MYLHFIKCTESKHSYIVTVSIAFLKTSRKIFYFDICIVQSFVEAEKKEFRKIAFDRLRYAL